MFVGTPGSKAAIRDLCQKAATKLKALKEGARETPGNTTIKDMPLSSTPERAWQTKLGVSPGRKQQVFLEKCHLLSKATQIETDELSSSQEDWEVLVCSSSSVQPLDMTPDKDRFYWNTTIQSIKYPSPPPPSLTSFNSSVATVIPNPVASLALEDSKYSLEEREYSRFIEEPPKMESVSMKKEEETVKFDVSALVMFRKQYLLNSYICSGIQNSFQLNQRLYEQRHNRANSSATFRQRYSSFLSCSIIFLLPVSLSPFLSRFIL